MMAEKKIKNETCAVCKKGKAEVVCTECKKAVCDNCFKLIENLAVCKECYKETGTSKEINMWGGALLIVIGIFFLLSFPINMYTIIISLIFILVGAWISFRTFPDNK